MIQSKGLRLFSYVLCATASMVVPAGVAAQGTDDVAVRFGAREDILNISLSPDGESIAMVMPRPGQGNELFVVPVAGGTPPKSILAASGDPERISNCDWVSNDRLLCNIFIVQKDVGTPVVLSRMVAVDAAGGNLKVVSTRQGADARGIAYFGGALIDLSPDGSGKVLVGRTYVPEGRTGTNIVSKREGYGVDLVDTRSLASKTVEHPKKDAIEYIGDGQGNIRIIGMNSTSDAGYASHLVKYHFRRPGSKDWENLSTYDLTSGQGFNPYAVDPKLNVAYGFRKKNGLQALVKVALDGSMAEEQVFARPDVDVDGLVRIGKSRRVVGATFATEKRQAEYFDPELGKLRTALGKALPGQLIQFVDASADEAKLLVWAGGDTNPGRYYLLDRSTRQMAELVPSRSPLAEVKLASVKPITYKAADGTSVPGYLTLPPESSGKNIPAIVMPHGGPSARDEWGFDWLAQYYANRGYAVLQPNFRGSAGYGDAWFKRNGFQSWQTAVGDVADAGRWLVSQGIADPKKLAIVGWSYGGYAALQSAVIAPDLFKAVVAIAPVTDLMQLKEDVMAYSSGRLARDFIGAGPHVREGSPAQRAAAIKAPVIQFHGTLDSNVRVTQARLMHDKLKDAGKRAELVIFEGLDHQLDDSAARAEMLRKSDQFIRAAIGQ